MADSASRKRALEILANPLSKESEWVGALSILDGKVPSTSSKSEAKLARFLKRVAVLSLLYTFLMMTWNVLVFGSGFSILPYTFGVAMACALAETSAGLFTAVALYCMLQSILTFNVPYPTTWMVILLNCFVYAKGNWRPYIMVPMQKAIQQQKQQKLKLLH